MGAAAGNDNYFSPAWGGLIVAGSALTAGVPLEIVQKVTGHRTAGIVMKHYFQPGREEFRRTLAGKLPALLGGGPPKVDPLNLAEVRAKLEGMESKNWREIRDGLLARFLPDLEKIISAEVVQIEVLAPVRLNGAVALFRNKWGSAFGSDTALFYNRTAVRPRVELLEQRNPKGLRTSLMVAGTFRPWSGLPDEVARALRRVDF